MSAIRLGMLLLKPLARAVPWWPLAAAATLAVLGQLPVLFAEPVAGLALPGLRLAAAALGAAACFALPDRMASTVLAPSPRWVRQWLRLALNLIPAVAVWVLLYLAVVAVGGRLVVEPAGYLTLQAAVCGLIPLAAAAVAARYRNNLGAALTGPLVQGVALVGTLFFPGTRSPWPIPPETGWTVAHLCWPPALVVSAAVLLFANRDVG
ncbi:hypothetical protein [Rhizomonospora bruguierae]|uniref:hypothetical protein n=1 Tax=Rhizomonospora bruguierae TaxID=1581705 RepID=UPI001BCD2CAA|nr:hypothetical protein [Micromonospora sp. NBRC 107566]